MTTLLLLVCAAQATTPGGWHVQAALPQTSAALRSVYLPNDPIAPIVQTTADLRVGVRGQALDLQLPWVNTWDRDERWSHSYPGQARLGLYGWMFHDHFQLGLEADFPVYQGEATGRSWGTYANEVRPSHAVATSFHTIWATENFSVTARTALGLRWGAHVFDLFYGQPGNTNLLIEEAFAITRHIRGPFGLAAELALVSDAYVPMFTTASLRIDLPVSRGWLNLDLGIQVPVHAPLQGDPLTAAVHPCAQLRWYPVLD